MASTKTNRPAPPKPASKPGMVKVVRAMYKYDAVYADELSFEEGDTLYIIDTTDANWWKAKCKNKTGLIPSNYVEENTESLEFPLHEAVKRGNLSFTKECILNRVSVNGTDKAGSTPIHWGAHGGHIECMKALLAEQHCQLNIQNKLGDTPLHSAAWKGHADAVEILLERGALSDLKNNEDKSALDLAKDPATAAVLQRMVRPKQLSTDYGDENDSD